MASDVKTVLVLLGDRSRPVTFKPTDDVVGDNQLLKQEIKDKFDDVLSPEDDVFLKLKDSTWDGMFVDLQDQTVENHDVLKAVPVQVIVCAMCTMTYSFIKFSVPILYLVLQILSKTHLIPLIIPFTVCCKECC